MDSIPSLKSRKRTSPRIARRRNSSLPEWPGEIVWHGWEVGNVLITGAALKQVPPRNPVRRAYELKPFGNRTALQSFSKKLVEGSPEWDVLYGKFFSEEEVRRGKR